jgi:hypothetical protein
MNILDEIRKSDKKPKELNAFIAKLILEKKPSGENFADALSSGSDSERGTCVEALEYATQTNPDIAKPYIASVISCLKDKAPRVKWEASRVIGNVSKVLPKETGEAVSGLLVNTMDKGTVVRWSTAFALSEIAKHNDKLRASLIMKINEIVKKEQNNGVKNVYLKALKVISKQNE